MIKLIKISFLPLRHKILIYSLLLLPVMFIGQYGYAQLDFIENKGQWNKAVKFQANVPAGAVFLTDQGFRILQQNESDLKNVTGLLHGELTPDKEREIQAATGKLTIRSHAYDVLFAGGNPHPEMVPEKMADTYNNYFIGKDKAKWQSGCRIFQAVTYKNIYPNIDVRYYSDAGTLKYDIIVYPGGDIRRIALQYNGVNGLQIKNKELVIGTSVGAVKELYPYTYQAGKSGRTVIDCKYVLTENTVRFKVGEYDPKSTVVIDPTLIFSSLTRSNNDNWGYTATPGPDGSMFAGGIVFNSGFPVSVGAFDVTFNGGSNEDPNGGYDIALIKLTPNGSNRLYGTYLGGSGNEQPHSMICDGAGNLILAGRSSSSDFPTTTPTFGSGGKYDIIITKFNPNGTAILGSVRIGGSSDDGVNVSPKYIPVNNSNGAVETRRNYGDDARSEVLIDKSSGDVFLVSCTMSNDFPVLNTRIQTSFGGGRQDGVIMRLQPDLSVLKFSTYFGGSGTDACFVLAFSPTNGQILIGGATTGANLPGDKNGVIGSNFNGGETDGFLTSISPLGDTIYKTSFLGTPGNDMLYGVQYDKYGFPYVMGTTTGEWPVLNAVFRNNNGRQFISKLQPNLSGYVYSTVFGSGSTIPNISPAAFLVDRCENVYVSGWGGRFNNLRGYPCAGTSGMPLVDPLPYGGDGNDMYFFVLEKDAKAQLFGSFFGQNGGFDDHVDGGTSRFDANGVIYQAICANCNNVNYPGVRFPTTPGAFGTVNGSVNCNEAAIKIRMDYAGVGASIRATVNGTIDTIGCVPLTIRFTDTLAKGKKYFWNFGDGSPEVTTIAPKNDTTHTYTRVGIYRVRLVSLDSTTCNITDTAYITVRVGNNLVTPSFIPTKLPPCTNLTFNFKNTTTASRPAFTSQTFVWDFGDNSPRVRTGVADIQHTYASVGTYNVTLLVDDTTFCNSPDSAKATIRLAINVKAGIETPDKGCAPYTALFNNVSEGGLSFKWYFGDGDSSSLVSPTHLYNNPGTYIVRLIAYDTSTCNKIDMATDTIQVYPVPTAQFTVFPNPGETNKAIQFSNASNGADSYIWNFGDGEPELTETNPSYLFNTSGNFNVCLQALNAAGCKDTFCLPVSAKVIPVLNIPNAFTPTQGGINAVIKVVGFGIGKMEWKIYNRWGQVVFATNNRRQGWDGTFKGVLQPMDVYSYTLDVVFTDGQTLRKTGDITLLR